MGRAIGAIAFIVLAFAVLVLFSERLGLAYSAGASFLVPVIGALGGVWALTARQRPKA